MNKIITHWNILIDKDGETNLFTFLVMSLELQHRPVCFPSVSSTEYLDHIATEEKQWWEKTEMLCDLYTAPTGAVQPTKTLQHLPESTYWKKLLCTATRVKAYRLYTTAIEKSKCHHFSKKRANYPTSVSLLNTDPWCFSGTFPTIPGSRSKTVIFWSS